MAVKEQKIAVDAVIDGKTFSEYALFDVLARQKRWRRPLLFAAIFTAFSLLADGRAARWTGSGRPIPWSSGKTA